MPYCVVKKCKYTSKIHRKTAGLSFHMFPVEPKMRDKWTEILRKNRKDYSWIPSEFSLICSTHFEEKDLYTTKHLRRIHKDAVPTLGLYTDDGSPESGYEYPNSGAPSGSSAQQDTLPEAKVIIANVYCYLQAELVNLNNFTGNSCDLSPLANILKRTADATGVSEETVIGILGERKRTEDARLKTSRRKRGKRKLSVEEDDVSPIEEESKSEDSEDDDGQANEDTTMEVPEHEIETVKIEIEEEDLLTKDVEPPDSARSRIMVEITPLETTSAVQHLLPTAHITVKTEPDDSEYRRYGSSEQSDKPGGSLVPVKIEPTEDVNQTMEPPVPQNKSAHGEGLAAKPPEDGR